MKAITPATTLEHPFPPVKSINYQPPLFSLGSMTPHSNASHKWIRGNREKIWREMSYYGVSLDYRVLTKGLFIKQFDHIRGFLQGTLGLTAKQREVIFALLKLWVHYGKCYPTVAMLCREAYCSKSTALRILKLFDDLGFIEVVHRDLKPYRRQISNLYLLHKLLLLIARYLAEHGHAFREKWLTPYLAMPGALFWSWRGGLITPSARSAPLSYP